MADTLDLLRRVPSFEGLPDDQITWFLSQSEELHLKPGEFYTRQGDPADKMTVILEGQVEARGELSGETDRDFHESRRYHWQAAVFQDEAILL